jgi:signal transduction histidine kinase/CheY-like chemotaxis protein
MLQQIQQISTAAELPGSGTRTFLIGAGDWLYTVSDAAIFGAYIAVLILIVSFLRRRPDKVLPKFWLVFPAFIFACGLGHLSVATDWLPWYHDSGLVKVLTGILSWATVASLISYLPGVLQLPAIIRLNSQLNQEIKDRREAEAAVQKLNLELKNRVQELETLLEVLPVGIGIALDPDCQVIHTNDAFSRLLQMAPLENASLSAAAGVAPKHFQVFQNGRELAPDELPIQMAASQKRVVNDFEEEVVFQNGTRLHLLAYAAPLLNDQGQVRGAVGAFVDVTRQRQIEHERQEVERRLQQSQKLESLGILAGGLAHDFNNLLTGILGNASLIRADLPKESELRPSAAQIEQAARQATHLCQQMLAFAGRAEVQVEVANLNQLVTATAQLIQSSIPPSVELAFDLTSQPCQARVDVTQIQQVIMNLIINAGDAMIGKTGTISVKTGITDITPGLLDDLVVLPEQTAGSYAYIQVTDQGCGMTKETLAKIFDPFFTTKFTGRGLGLAAIVGILKKHSGALQVTTEFGIASRFLVMLPLVYGEVTKTTVIKSKTTMAQRSGTVLIIDDDEMLRTVTGRLLKRFGFQVVLAPGGVEGVGAYQQQQEEIAFVMLDLTMPGLGGEETFHRLRAVNAGVKVLLMSGFDERETRSRFAEGESLLFLPKPFGIEALIDRLDGLLPTAAQN